MIRNKLLIWVMVLLSVVSFVAAHSEEDDFGHHCGMMGFGAGFGWGLFGWLMMVLVIAVLILLIVWLIKQINKTNK